MGKLAERAKQRSPFIRLMIGEKTTPMKYRSWKEITTNFGNPGFRYSFEVETSEGFVTKTLDNSSEAFAQAMDKIPFNAYVVISRQLKLDKNGNPIPDKSIYTVKVVSRVVKAETLSDGPAATGEVEKETEGQKGRPEWAEEILGEEGSSGEEGES